MVFNEIYNRDIKEKILSIETKNGLKIYYMPKKGYTKKYAIFSTNYGSIDNTFIPIGESDALKVPEGIAHFLEHKLFEEAEDNIFDQFSKMGADVNAFTSFNQTSYLFQTTDYFYENLELLIKFVQNPYFTDENIEKEKGIIAQEIRMYDDDPGWRVYFNLLGSMYSNNPVKEDIAGTVESIQDINRDLLYKCYNTFYHPKNMVLFVIGDLEFDKIVAAVEKTERDFPNIFDDVRRIQPSEPDAIKNKLIEEKMMTSSPIFYMGFKDSHIGYRGKEKIKKDIVTNIIMDMLFGSSSIFYNKLYEEGLIDSSFGAFYTGKETYGHSLILGESKKPKEVYKRIIEYLESKPEEVLEKDDFNRIKKKNLGEFLISLNSIQSIANNFTDLFFDDFIILDYFDLLKEIRYEDIIKRYKEHFIEENSALSIINPI